MFQMLKIVALLAVGFSIVAWSTLLVGPQLANKEIPSQDNRSRSKSLREIAQDRDVEISDTGTDSETDYENIQVLKKNAVAIVYGRISDVRSFFDESGHPIEHGELITTEYTVDVYRVLKDTTLNTPPVPGRPGPPRHPW